MTTSTPAKRGRYPSDLNERQWNRIDLLLPNSISAVRMREALNAISYRWTTGCSWRMLPHDFPHWATVYTYFRRLQRLGLLAAIRKIMLTRNRAPRSKSNPHPSPSEPRREPNSWGKTGVFSAQGDPRRTSQNPPARSSAIEWERDDARQLRFSQQSHQ
jgi:transposase